MGPTRATAECGQAMSHEAAAARPADARTLCEAAQRYCAAKARLSRGQREDRTQFLAARDVLRVLLESLWPGPAAGNEVEASADV